MKITPRKEFNEQAWEFARTVAEIDKQLLSETAVRAITDMLVLAHEQAVKETAEHCATKAKLWQGQAIAPFESCGCGTGISEAIRSAFGLTVQSPANGEASDTGAQGVGNFAN